MGDACVGSGGDAQVERWSSTWAPRPGSGAPSPRPPPPYTSPPHALHARWHAHARPCLHTRSLCMQYTWRSRRSCCQPSIGLRQKQHTGTVSEGASSLWLCPTPSTSRPIMPTQEIVFLESVSEFFSEQLKESWSVETQKNMWLHEMVWLKLYI